jgi:hypothetical protein
MELLSRAVSADDPLIQSIRFDSIFALPQFAFLWGDGIFYYVEIRDTNAETDTVTPVCVKKVPPNLTVALCPSSPQIIDGPSGASNWKEILRALLSFLKENHKCVAVTINQKPPSPQFLRDKLDGCRLSYSYDVMIDLSNELRILYYNMDKRHRYTLRKSSHCSDAELSSGDWLENTGFIIRQGTREESLQEFYALWRENMWRNYERLSYLNKLLFIDDLSLNTLVTRFKKLYPYGLFKLFTIYDKDCQPGASAIFYTSNNLTTIPMVYWTEIASSEDGRKKGLPTLLLWYSIQWFKKHGFRRYYMGGYYLRDLNKAHSLYKRGFGAQTVSGLSLSWLTQPIRPIYNIASSFIQPLTPAYYYSLENLTDRLRAKLLRRARVSSSV